MKLSRAHDEYWRAKPYGIEEARVEGVCAEFGAGQAVLDVGCGKGEMGHALAGRGVKVIGVDFSEVAAPRARQGGLEVLILDSERQALPFSDGEFDGVLFTQLPTHLYDFRPIMKEIRRVLRPGGRFVFCVPNIAHWRFRLWLLSGEFPYIQESPTTWQHLRFFTRKSAERTLRELGFDPVKVRGTPGMFSPIYPAFLNWKGVGIRRLYNWLCRTYPGVFAFHLTFVCRQKEPDTSG